MLHASVLFCPFQKPYGVVNTLLIEAQAWLGPECSSDSMADDMFCGGGSVDSTERPFVEMPIGCSDGLVGHRRKSTSHGHREMLSAPMERRRGRLLTTSMADLCRGFSLSFQPRLMVQKTRLGTNFRVRRFSRLNLKWSRRARLGLSASGNIAGSHPASSSSLRPSLPSLHLFSLFIVALSSSFLNLLSLSGTRSPH